MRLKRTALFAATIALLTPALLSSALLTPAAAAADSTGNDHHGIHSRPVATTLTTGLSGASGSTIGPDGALYVTEATLGQVTRIDTRTGEKSVYASGLPPAVIDLGGALDVVFIGRTAYVLVTLVSSDVGGTNVSGIYRVDDRDSFTVIADIGAWAIAHPPATPFDVPSGLQFALDRYRGGFLVTDGHHNRVLSVSRSGVIRQVVQFGNTVPTGLDVRRKSVFLAEAGAVPHAPADGKVVVFGTHRPQPRVLASGYSLLVDVEFDSAGCLYALSQGDSPGQVPAGSPALADSGELLRVTPGGRLVPVVAGLDLPTSVDFSRRAAFVVTIGGEVLRITGLPKR